MKHGELARFLATTEPNPDLVLFDTRSDVISDEGEHPDRKTEDTEVVIPSSPSRLSGRTANSRQLTHLQSTV
jgi:hypothetical protein